MANEKSASNILRDPVRVMRRAIKFASKDRTRPILCTVHLDESGEVAATDSFRLFVERNAWSGPSIDIDYGTAYDISKCKLKGNEQAVIEVGENPQWAGGLTVKMGDGTVIKGATVEGKYPSYGDLMNGLKPKTVAYVKPEQVVPALKELMKDKDERAYITVNNRDFHLTGQKAGSSHVKLDKACSGEDTCMAFNPRFLKEAVEAVGDVAEIHMTAKMKPAIVTDGGSTTVLVMPMRFDDKPAKKGAKMSKKQAPEKVDAAEVAKTVYNMAVDKAAADEDSRVSGGNTGERERRLVWQLQKDNRLTSESHGDFTTWMLDGKFLTCIEERRSTRKIHLHYPMLKPKAHKVDKVAELKAKHEAEKDDCFAEALVNKPKHPEPPKSRVKAPKVPKVKKEDAVSDEVEKLRKQLDAVKASRHEYEELYRAERKSADDLRKGLAEMTELAKKARAEVDALKAEPEKPEQIATVISLETMQQWCEGKGLEAKQAHPGSKDNIWILGPSKPYKDELLAMGFRYARKSRMGKGWYAKPTA